MTRLISPFLLEYSSSLIQPTTRIVIDDNRKLEVRIFAGSDRHRQKGGLGEKAKSPKFIMISIKNGAEAEI